MAPNITDCLVAQEIKPCEPTEKETLHSRVQKSDPNNNSEELVETPQSYQKPKSEQSLVWRNVVILAYAHVACCFGLYHMFTDSQRGSVIFGKFSLSKNFSSN